MVSHKSEGSVVQSVIFNDYPNYEMARRSEAIEIGELKEMILDTRAAYQATTAIHHSMLGQEPSPDKLISMALRRRPTRHQAQDRIAGATERVTAPAAVAMLRLAYQCLP
jgi:hypothetical protein